MEEKWVQYAAKISQSISEMLTNEDHDWHIDKSELSDEENFKQFFHALANVAPAYLFNRLVHESAQRDQLAFNQMANTLCFEYCKPENK
jgi:hypothetical protein